MLTIHFQDIRISVIFDGGLAFQKSDSQVLVTRNEILKPKPKQTQRTIKTHFIQVYSSSLYYGHKYNWWIFF